MPSSSIRCSRPFAMQASTALRQPRSEFADINNCIVAAQAATDPSRHTFRAARQWIGSDQSSKPYACQIHSWVTRALVQMLLSPRRPSTVLRCVVSVVVDAINGMHRRRTATHVGEEGLKRPSPAITDSNASGTVVLKLLRAWVVTPLLHARPCCFFRCSSVGHPRLHSAMSARL